MDKRKLKITIGKAGGNASKSAKKYLLSIPNSWANEMKIDQENRSLITEFDGETIMIRKEKK